MSNCLSPKLYRCKIVWCQFVWCQIVRCQSVLPPTGVLQNEIDRRIALLMTLLYCWAKLHSGNHHYFCRVLIISYLHRNWASSLFLLDAIKIQLPWQFRMTFCEHFARKCWYVIPSRLMIVVRHCLKTCFPVFLANLEKSNAILLEIFSAFFKLLDAVTNLKWFPYFPNYLMQTQSWDGA